MPGPMPRRQVARFFEAPTRNLLNEPDPESLKGGIGDFCQRVTTRLSEAGSPTRKHCASEELQVVLGIGLGLHLPELMARSQCRCLVLIEPTLENALPFPAGPRLGGAGRGGRARCRDRLHHRPRSVIAQKTLRFAATTPC